MSQKPNPQKKIQTRNPNVTFIRVTLGKQNMLAFIDTGAALCFGRANISSEWKRLKESKKIIVADKSVHEINFAIEHQILKIENKLFPIRRIYLHDSGLDLILGNNFLKLYSPFCQDIRTISLKCPFLGRQESEIVQTKIITKFEVIRMHLGYLQSVLEESKFMFQTIDEKLLEVCSEDPLDLKKNTNNELVEIKLKDPTAEVNVPNRIPYTIKDVEEFTKECETLLEKGIIRPSKSPHSAPAFYVENHNEIKRGKRRMVINYKKMNDATIGDPYSLPRKDFILEKVKGCRWYTSLDAKSGYWQLRLHENTKPLTAFSCPPQKHYEWNVMPFGLKQAPAIYQDFMDRNLEGLEQFCLAYIDDILIFTKKDKIDHLEKLEIVLNRIKERGLIISQKKSKIACEELEYLGLILGKDGKIDLAAHVKEKLDAFPNELEDRKQIQRFLGVLNYVADQGFVKNLASLRKELQKKLKKGIHFQWTKEDSLLVQRIKDTIKVIPQLYNPNINDFLVIETDASGSTWAGCMLALKDGKRKLSLNEFGKPKTLEITDNKNYQAQEDDSDLSSRSLDESLDRGLNSLDNPRKLRLSERTDRNRYQALEDDGDLSNRNHFTVKEQDEAHSLSSPFTSKEIKSDDLLLCKYTSGTFNSAELNYTIQEKETLACLRVLKKWRCELLTTRFELRIDSTYTAGFWRYKLEEGRNKGRLIRWQLQLQQYDPYIKIIKSEHNSFADSLTREWSQKLKS
ncbi:polymerase [Soymovirus malvae]|nr:polymerase [Malva associated soymovirus 1]